MKPSSRLFSTAVLLAVLSCAAPATPQAPQAVPAQPSSAGPHHGHPLDHYVPTNLKVLPRNLTDEQLHTIMEGWAAALGTHCSTCHVAYPNSAGPNGHLRMNFADDSRPEKSTARLMYKMVQDINGNYISMIDNSGARVTCGTCHRGHLSPDPFIAPPEHHGPPPMPPAAH